MCQYCAALAKAIDNFLIKADNDLKDQLAEEGYAEPKKTVNHISELEDEIAGVLTEETDYILTEADKAPDLASFEKTWKKIKAGDTLKEDLRRVLSGKLQTIVPQYAGCYMSGIDSGLSVTTLSKGAAEWIESWSEELGEIMQLSSHEEIERILKTGLEEGQSMAEFIRSIQESGIRDEYYRARSTAVTEVLTAHRAAQQEAFMQAPCITGKAWKHTGVFITAPRQNHLDMDGVVVAKDEPFELVGADGAIYYPMYPGDTSLPAGERINCHCIDQPIVDESILGLSLEERQALQQKAIDEMDEDWEAQATAEAKARAQAYYDSQS